MTWLVLIAGFVALYFGLVARSGAVMAGCILISLFCFGAWVWLRYRMLFPKGTATASMTPLDPAEVERLRAQTAANRAEEAARIPAQEAEEAHPIHPVAPEVPALAAQVEPPTPTPAPVVERPITGRAVFAVPDDPPLPAAHVPNLGDRG